MRSAGEFAPILRFLLTPIPPTMPVVAIMVATVAAAVPTELTAQIGSCVECVRSPWNDPFDDVPDVNTICAGSHTGKTECSQSGTRRFHSCDTWGADCDDGVDDDTDEMAIARLLMGEPLPLASDYFALLEADDIVLMRACGAVVTRIPVREFWKAPTTVWARSVKAVVEQAQRPSLFALTLVLHGAQF